MTSSPSCSSAWSAWKRTPFAPAQIRVRSGVRPSSPFARNFAATASRSAGMPAAGAYLVAPVPDGLQAGLLDVVGRVEVGLSRREGCDVDPLGLHPLGAGGDGQGLGLGEGPRVAGERDGGGHHGSRLTGPIPGRQAVSPPSKGRAGPPPGPVCRYPRSARRSAPWSPREQAPAPHPPPDPDPARRAGRDPAGRLHVVRVLAARGQRRPDGVAGPRRRGLRVPHLLGGPEGHGLAAGEPAAASRRAAGRASCCARSRASCSRSRRSSGRSTRRSRSASPTFSIEKDLLGSELIASGRFCEGSGPGARRRRAWRELLVLTRDHLEAEVRLRAEARVRARTGRSGRDDHGRGRRRLQAGLPRHPPDARSRTGPSAVPGSSSRRRTSGT